MRNFKILLTLFISLWLVSGLATAHAALSDPLTTIELDTPVHFLAPDGSDLLIEAGTYSVEPAEEWIRVMSGERRDALLIEAQKGTHELELEQPMALSVPGDSDNEQDHHYVMLLLPGGKSLEATGTYSGIRTRGFFQDSAKKVKTTAKKVHKKAKSTAEETTSRAEDTAEQARDTAEQARDTARQANEQAQESARQGTQQARKNAQNVGKQIKKTGKQAGAHVRKGRQTARNAALYTKREIEKTARQNVSKVKRRIRNARETVTGGSGPWTLWSQTAGAAARKEALGWLSQAYIDESLCEIFAASAFGKPGVLKSRYSFKGEIGTALKAAGASKALAEGGIQPSENPGTYGPKTS